MQARGPSTDRVIVLFGARDNDARRIDNRADRVLDLASTRGPNQARYLVQRRRMT